jgi:hypothetical protein
VATPSLGAYDTTTSVTINGQNFAEPVQAEWVPSGGSAGTVHLNVSSVSAAAIIVQLPPIDPQQAATGGAACSNLVGTINLTFPALACAGPFSTPFTYKIDPPQITRATPTSIPQSGGGLTITVSGAFFSDPMTVVLLKDGSPLNYTEVNNPVVSNSATLTFPAPAIYDADLNTQACVIGSSVTGTKFVNTSFGIRVTNARTGCSADLLNVLIYTPLDTTCRSLPVVAGPATLPAANLCAAYSGATATPSGGTAPYTWSASGLPPGMTINALTGVISGTPTLTAPGPSLATTVVSVTITVTDAILQSGSRTYSLILDDPAGPFTVTAPAASTISSAAGGTISGISVPGAFGPISWTLSGMPAGVTIGTPGNPTSITVPIGTALGAYTLSATATDSACGGVSHTNSGTINLTVNP